MLLARLGIAQQLSLIAQTVSTKGDLNPRHLRPFIVTIGSDNCSTLALSRTTTLPMHDDRSFPFDSESFRAVVWQLHSKRASCQNGFLYVKE